MSIFTESAHVHAEADYLPAPPSEIIVPASEVKKTRKVPAVKPPSDTLFAPIFKAGRRAVSVTRDDGYGQTVTVGAAQELVNVHFEGQNDRSLPQKLAANRSATTEFEIGAFSVGDHEWQTLPAARFLSALEYVARAASTDATRPRLTGVFFGGSLTSHAGDWVATDGHRLHLAREMPALSGSDIIVPSWAIETVQRAGRWLRPETVQVTQPDDKSIAFRMQRDGSSAVIVARLVDGRFPDYRTPIPTIDAFTAGKPSFSTMVSSGKALTTAFKFAPKRGIDKNAAFDISVGDALAVIPTTGAHYPLPAKAHPAPVGGAWAIALNARYLTEAVEGVDGLALQFISDLDPVRIDSDLGGLSLKAVIMPMRR